MHPRLVRPQTGKDYAQFYDAYVCLVPEGEIVEIMTRQRDETVALLRSIPREQSTICHAPYTWTIRQVVGHLIDAERVFGYRAMRIARGDATPLPGFEETSYVVAGEFDRIELPRLTAEFASLRDSHISMFTHFPNDAWSRRGVASNVEVSVPALAYILVGHVMHHMDVVKHRLDLKA